MSNNFTPLCVAKSYTLLWWDSVEVHRRKSVNVIVSKLLSLLVNVIVSMVVVIVIAIVLSVECYCWQCHVQRRDVKIKGG